MTPEFADSESNVKNARLKSRRPLQSQNPVQNRQRWRDGIQNANREIGVPGVGVPGLALLRLAFTAAESGGRG